MGRRHWPPGATGPAVRCALGIRLVGCASPRIPLRRSCAWTSRATSLARGMHWFGPAGDQPVEILSLLGPQGERIHVRAAPRRTAENT